MQAIILAAGSGARLYPKTRDIAKCMVEVNGQTLIKRQIEYLNKAGIEKIIIVCGYKKDKLINYINKEFENSNIVFVENDEYMKTNNIYSLYLAKEYLAQDDTILLDSDLIFDYKILSDVVNSEKKNIIAIDKFLDTMNGTVIDIDCNGLVKEILNSREIDSHKMSKIYKTINIYKMGKEFINLEYIPTLEEYIAVDQKNEYYETVFKKIIKESKVEINTIIFEKEKWYEIDTKNDLEIAECLFANSYTAVENYNNRYGGYWRFKNLKDFCYLVVPTFPTENMKDRMRCFLGDFLKQYPSTLNIQNSNAASFFNIDSEKIIVGNGASELMKALGRILNGKMSIRLPVFNEYLEDFNKCTLRKNYTYVNDYKYGKENIISEIYKSDNLVLVNPDNPSGNFIEYDDMKEILDVAKERNTTIIFDESYIDFVDKDKRYTLIKNDILEEYPNLVVIKSLGKSYGVAGIRLGMMASGNKKIIEEVKKEVNIWNINAFAEYFMQIIELYKKEYAESCSYLCKQRKKMMEELEKIDYLKVYDSQANFIMCEVNGSSKDLVQYLLQEHNIFIKDLTNKEGMNLDKNYIRMSIKEEHENYELINALKEYKIENRKEGENK